MHTTTGKLIAFSCQSALEPGEIYLTLRRVEYTSSYKYKGGVPHRTGGAHHLTALLKLNHLATLSTPAAAAQWKVKQVKLISGDSTLYI